MGTKHRYQQTISNSYLGETKVISGNDPEEVQSKIAQQRAKWQEKASLSQRATLAMTRENLSKISLLRL
jgi:hypothetical protein